MPHEQCISNVRSFLRSSECSPCARSKSLPSLFESEFLGNLICLIYNSLPHLLRGLTPRTCPQKKDGQFTGKGRFFCRGDIKFYLPPLFLFSSCRILVYLGTQLCHFYYETAS